MQTVDSHSRSTEDCFTYLGILDDEVERYPFQTTIDQNYIFRSLLKSVFFGGPLLLNDGYLLQHSFCRGALFGDASHPLRVLIDEGFVAVVSLTNDLEESLEKRAVSGVETIKSALTGPDEAKVRKSLQGLSAHLNSRQLIFPWPKKDTGHGFYLTIQRCRGRSAEEIGLRTLTYDALQSIFSEFDKEMKQSTLSARTKWRDLAGKVIKDELPTSRFNAAFLEAMNLANEAYHYNFVTCLAPEIEFGIGVETQQSDTFDELVDIPDVTYATVSQMPAVRTPKIDLTKQGAQLRDFLLRGHKLHDLKQSFLRDQRLYVDGLVDRGWLTSTRDEYVRKIHEHFRTKVDITRYDQALSWVLLGTTSAGAWAAGLDTVAGTAVSALVLTAQQASAPSVLNKFKTRNVPIDLVKMADETLTQAVRQRVRKRQAISSVLLEDEKARALASNGRDVAD